MFSTSTVPINEFSTTFTFQITGPGTQGDGFTFTVQGVSPTSVGSTGGGLGYQGINNSLAVKFDLYNNAGEGNDSTGLYENGAAPTVPFVDLSSSINLHSGDLMSATISYDGSTIYESITDTVTNASFNTSYTGINLASLVGSSNGYVGFTGASGGVKATQAIESWVYTVNTGATASPPAVPQNLQAFVTGYTAGSTTPVPLGATVTWSTVPDAQSYIVERSLGDDLHYQQVATTTTPAFYDTGLATESTYYYEVAGVNQVGQGAFSTETSITTPALAPTPSNGQPVNITPTSITLTWTDNANNEAGFQIFRSVNNGAFSLLVSLPADLNPAPSTDTYTDSGLTPNTRYDYHIQAFNLAGYSDFTGVTAYTPQVPASAPPAAPSALSATTFSSSQINLSWTDNDVSPNLADSYAVEESTDGVNFTQIVLLPSGSSSYSVVGLLASTLYDFRVRAHDTMGYSSYSNVASASTNSSSMNFSSGFGSGTSGILTFNGGATTSGSNLVLTDGQPLESRSVFTTAPVGISTFTTTFTFLITGSQTQGDGFTFTVENTANTALGANGAGLGSQGIAKSLAVKFDLYSNAGEGNDSTGVFTNGALPTTPAIDMTGVVNLHAGDLMSATIAYNGSNLVETLTDLATNQTFTHTYTGINIPSLLGGTLGFVGFTGSTGGFKATQVVKTWTFSDLPNPATNLSANPASPTEIDLAWTDNDVAPNLATGYSIKESTDGVHFNQIAVGPPGSTAYNVVGLQPATNYYFIVQAQDASGVSNPTNVVASATPSVPINFPTGFATGTSGVLSFNGGAGVTGSNLVLTDGQPNETRSVFSTTSTNVNVFSTTFEFQITGALPLADGFTFTIQGVGNARLGSAAPALAIRV